MFRWISACNFLFLVLVLGSCISLASCDDDDDSEEAAAPPAAVEDDVSEEQTESVKVDVGNSNPELEECTNPGNSTKEKCCKNGLVIDDALMKCFILHQKKAPKDGGKNPAKLIKFMSCLVECVYKAKKYISKGDTVNMKMVKSDANKLHKDDPKQRDYMIEMYQHCERNATHEWRNLKKNPAAKVIFTGACKPYYTFVFLCIIDYGSKVSCPHFVWKGSKENVEICKEMKEKCEELLKA